MGKLLDQAGLTYFWSKIKAQLAGKVPMSRTVCGKALTANVTLAAKDVGAYPAGSIRTVSISLSTSAWTGSGPYTATITRSDVTTKTWVDFSLTAASLANYAAAIDWSTETAGKIVLTTAVKPTGTIAGTITLMEVT